MRADTVAVVGTAAVDLDLTAGAAAQSAAISVAEVTATAVDTALTAATTAAMAATVTTAGGAAWATGYFYQAFHCITRHYGGTVCRTTMPTTTITSGTLP